MDFPDANLAAKVREILNLSAGADIPLASLQSMTFLSAFNAGITDLTGLEQATELTNLNLNNNEITNIDALESLTKLTNLSLANNEITNIDVLSNLTSLTGLLTLLGNPINDFSPLSSLINLTQLNLIRTEFSDSDIDLLAPLTSLITLDLSENKISDMDRLVMALSGTNNLQYLYLGENRISDLSPLEDLTHLREKIREFSFNDNDISDVTPLEFFPRLTHLYLSKNRISDLSPLSGLTDLEWSLQLNDNRISDLSPLSGLTILKRLDFSNNQVSDLSPLTTLTELLYLFTCCNLFTNIRPLEALTNLETLHIDEELWENPVNKGTVDKFPNVSLTLCPSCPRPPPPSKPESESESESEPKFKKRKYIQRCGLGWTPQPQWQPLEELPKVMIYALEFEYDPGRNAGYSCKVIEIRTGDHSIENLAGWKLYLGTLYNQSRIPLEIPEAHSQITDNILRLTPDMLGLETFPCNTAGGISHPLPGVHYVLKTDENILVDTAYSCFIWGQNAWTTVNGVNVRSQRSISSAVLRGMDTPRIERYIMKPNSVFITYTGIEEFGWDRLVLSDWLLPLSEVSAPGAPSVIRRKLITTWGTLKKQ